MSIATAAVFIIGAKRTPFGAFGGKLKQLSAIELAVSDSIISLRCLINLLFFRFTAQRLH
jgi:hypothetical protein